MAEMKRRGLSALSPKVEDLKKPESRMPTDENDGDGETRTTITHHADGTHSMESHGERSDHPDHLHLLAAIGHRLTGGDRHHVVHDDGMEAHSHGIHESGEHEETRDHATPEDAAMSLHQFLGGENGEPETEDDEQPEQAYGGIAG